MCMHCTWDLRLGARRRVASMRKRSPICSIKGKRGWLVDRTKRPRLLPAVGTAEREVRTKEQQPVDTASVDENKQHMDDKHERLSPAAGTAESEMRTMAQQPVVTASAAKHERVQIEHALDIYREAREQIRNTSKKGRVPRNQWARDENEPLALTIPSMNCCAKSEMIQIDAHA